MLIILALVSIIGNMTTLIANTAALQIGKNKQKIREIDLILFFILILNL